MRSLKLLLSIAFLAGFLMVAAMFVFAIRPLTLKTSPLEFNIPTGVGLRAASRVIAQSGVDFSPWQFSLLGRAIGKASSIKAGSYEIVAGVTPLQLLDKLTLGDVSQGEVVFVEGRRFSQLRAVLNANVLVQHDTIDLSEPEILARIGASEAHAEGLFAPDTYLFPKNSSDVDILRRAYRAMRLQLASEWMKRAPSLPYGTPYEALILASIVEKETGVATDRPQVAAVFLNRLRSGMPLQTDPTVIYGLGERFDGNLRKRDLQSDTPYNSYTRTGLPPTPIAMPGAASLQAVLHPPVTDKYYFVARGDGSSEFSRTLEEHNRAVLRYQRRSGESG
jgi:UPF0755 protein